MSRTTFPFLILLLFYYWWKSSIIGLSVYPQFIFMRKNIVDFNNKFKKKFHHYLSNFFFVQTSAMQINNLESIMNCMNYANIEQLIFKHMLINGIQLHLINNLQWKYIIYGNAVQASINTREQISTRSRGMKAIYIIYILRLERRWIVSMLYYHMHTVLPNTCKYYALFSFLMIY